MNRQKKTAVKQTAVVPSFLNDSQNYLLRRALNGLYVSPELSLLCAEK